MTVSVDSSQLVVEIDNPCPDKTESRVIYRLPKPITFIVSVATKLHVILQTLRKASTAAEKGQICSFNCEHLNSADLADSRSQLQNWTRNSLRAGTLFNNILLCSTWVDQKLLSSDLLRDPF